METDDLYRLPLERFVAERTALARALRSGGRREEAAAVAALRKPSVAAWTVNQLVRGEAELVAELFAAGDAQRAALTALLGASGDRAALRTAGARERDAVERLVAAARDRFDAGGPALDRIADTLHAAALDDDARTAVAAGCLVRELSHVGMGAAATSSAAAPAARARPVPAAAPPPPPRPAPEAERVARERAERRRAARLAESAARRELDAADRAVSAAHDRRQRAAEALAQADAALAAAEARAAAAAQAHERALVERG